MLYDIEEFKGLYQIDEKGQVWSVGRYDTLNRWKPSVKMKLHEHNNGYLFYNLKVGKKQHTRLQHRLVAIQFIDNPYELPEVNHKDGNKKNNTIVNLEWVTRSENIKHAYTTGLKKPHDTILDCQRMTWKPIKVLDKNTDTWYTFDNKTQAVKYFKTGLSYFSDLQRKYNGENKRFKMEEL